jgi:hypothetical protein
MAKKFLKVGFNVIVYVFAAIGLFLVAGYFAIQSGLTNEKGIIDNQRAAFLSMHRKVPGNSLRNGRYLLLPSHAIRHHLQRQLPIRAYLHVSSLPTSLLSSFVFSLLNANTTSSFSTLSRF